jgi:NADPH-dependent 2,4-dienoyl-CoA reductase/sulfur reductase-like enzyme
MTQYVILGSGVAGMSAAEAIRRHENQASITLIGDDLHGFYSRPGLAYYLTGEIPKDSLFCYPPQAYKLLNAKFIRGRASRILPAEHQVQIDDEKLSFFYDRLLVATGSYALKPNVPGIDLNGVVKLDHLDDAMRIISLAKKAKKAIIVGGGITALELAEGLVACRVKVHYLLRGDRYWGNVLDENESRVIEHRLKEHRVTIQYQAELMEILGKAGRVTGVRLASGETIPCDIVAVAIGIKPRLELAQASGIVTDRGILTDEYLQTNLDAVYAAGDVAQAIDALSGKHVLDTLWTPAREQGWIAGLNMVGVRTPYCKSPPFNVTRLAGITTTIIGQVGGGRDSDVIGIARGDSETWRDIPEAIVAQSGFEINRLRLMVGDKHLLGAVVMGDQKLSFPIQNIIAKKMDITPIRSELLASGAPIADLLVNYWTKANASDNVTLTYDRGPQG